VSVAVPHSRRLGIPPSAAVLIGGTALLASSVALNTGPSPLFAVGLLLTAGLVATHHWLFRWPTLITGLLLVILFIPINRYDLPASLPFTLEPYRAVAALLLAGWLTSLMIDEKVKARATSLEGPLALIVTATLGSELFNPGRVGDNTTYVVKALTFFVSFVLVVYLVVSVVRSRALVDRIVRVLVAGGAFVAFTSIVERSTSFNLFNHLGVIPMLSYHEVAADVRNGAVRAVGSSAHPIELGVVLTMFLPLAFYLALHTRRRGWWLALGTLLLGNLATGSRTGVIGLVAVVLVFLWLRPREVRRLWPLLLPAIVAVHFVVPGALGGVVGAFFPTGGLIAEQAHAVKGNERLASNRLADWGPSFAEYSSHNPLFGEGFGTRVTGFGNADGNAAILDDQWLKTLLETGVLGVFGWLWVFVRVIRRLGASAREHAADTAGWLPVALAASLAAYALAMVTYDAFSFIQGTFLAYILIALAAVILRLDAEQR
jgi:hypothetical protein